MNRYYASGAAQNSEENGAVDENFPCSKLAVDRNRVLTVWREGDRRRPPLSFDAD
ncbi:hypothetical protein EPIR_3676 [Erwinia piriflorinigrans CFBP 5888]|uniref:Uncharacterized protein n=1 Tax=Erwinia piriflorinigrans CFBP 5888 TaxID=1161919 RepID=V5ZDD9_9GAMM|nr:hypothetical protein EPIR_3676 [Erwinia piriflorinigrans CFBP 5888]